MSLCQHFILKDCVHRQFDDIMSKYNFLTILLSQLLYFYIFIKLLL